MSSTNHIPLTEEQEQFLKTLEEDFKDRYTEKDEEFKEILYEKPSTPPVIKNWIDSRLDNWRNNYRHDRRRGRHWDDDRSHGRHWDDDRSHGRHWDDERSHDRYSVSHGYRYHPHARYPYNSRP